MNIYYKSVGRGALLLLNSTPDTTGSIPQSHVNAYAKFGKEIMDEFPTIFRVKIRSDSLKTTGKVTIKRLMY